MEAQFKFSTYEQGRNAAIKWLEGQSVTFGTAKQKVEIGRLASNRFLFGREVGVSSRDPFFRLRLDYDPSKGPHFNAECGKGAERKKAAFLFKATDEMMEKWGRKRAVR